MNKVQANKEAAEQSKSGATRFVVWVFDKGLAVFSAEQARAWARRISIEAAFLDGMQIAKR
ncbi:MAG: hypothetical protein JWP38_3701 [Herbaspirillum sp.]|nr:hypothetical protein [Herbaspirillum sp.]